MHFHADDEKERGFTLIELLVVITIIGVLSAIAIPMFLNQRQTANDAAVESDIKNAAIAVQTFFTVNRTADGIDPTYIKSNMKKSEGVFLRFSGTRDDWCINGYHANGDVYRDWANNKYPDRRPYALYRSTGGGMIDKTTHHSTLECSQHNNWGWGG